MVDDPAFTACDCCACLFRSSASSSILCWLLAGKADVPCYFCRNFSCSSHSPFLFSHSFLWTRNNRQICKYPPKNCIRQKKWKIKSVRLLFDVLVVRKWLTNQTIFQARNCIIIDLHLFIVFFLIFCVVVVVVVVVTFWVNLVPFVSSCFNHV